MKKSNIFKNASSSWSRNFSTTTMNSGNFSMWSECPASGNEWYWESQIWVVSPLQSSCSTGSRSPWTTSVGERILGTPSLQMFPNQEKATVQYFNARISYEKLIVLFMQIPFDYFPRMSVLEQKQLQRHFFPVQFITLFLFLFMC